MLIGEVGYGKGVLRGRWDKVDCAVLLMEVSARCETHKMSHLQVVKLCLFVVKCEVGVLWIVVAVDVCVCRAT